MRRHHAIWLMALCLWVAAALRLPDLPTIPPGVHFDEAANGILAAEIGLAGERPIFITSYTGKEVLFFYLAGVLARLLGPGVFSLRLTAVFVGLLTIAVTYRLGQLLLRDRRLALLAASLLAISFWHLLLSRLGFRAITQPLLQGLTVWGIWRGLQVVEEPGQRAWPWALLGGIALGLTAYTYLAARLFPLLLLLALMPYLLSRRNRPAFWRFLLLSGSAAVMTLLPLLRFFLAQPDAFWVRINQVSPEQSITVWTGLGRSLAMLFWRGDAYWRFNLPEAPLFGPFWAICLLLGLFWLVRGRHGQANGLTCSAALLLGLNLFIMILPTALATNEILPSNLRAVGLIPLIFFLPALGLGRTAAWLGRRWSRLSLATPLFPLLLLAVLAGGGAITASAYFRDWAGRSDVFYETDADLTAVAAYLEEQSLDRRTYLAARHYRHPTIAFLTDAYAALKWLPGSEAIVFPATGSAVYIYPHNSPAPDWLSDHLPTAPAPGPAGPDGEPTYVIYEVSTPPPIRLAHQTAVNLGGHVNLLGYELGPAGAGKKLTVTLLWRVLSPPAGSYLPFIQLEDAEQRRWAQLESGAYPSEQWEVGETVLQQMVLPIPPGAPPGQYRLRLGFFNPDTGEQLVRLDNDGRFAGAAFVIDPIFVSAGSIPDLLPTPPVTLDESPLPGLTIVGFEPPPATVPTGSTLSVALWWTATAAPGDLITRLELIRADNTGRILLDTQPVYNTYPFAEWQTPLFLIDPLRALIPADFPPGNYELLLRLLRADGGTLLEQRLGPVQVEATERVFTPPPTEDELAARYGGEIDLLGYDLTPNGENAFVLDLVWQAVQTPSADYTVFVHLLDGAGVCCIWQQDSWPQQGRYATSRWLPTEVVSDRYLIELPSDLPAGSYAIEVGLYLADSGHRLQVITPDQPPADAILLPSLRRP